MGRPVLLPVLLFAVMLIVAGVIIFTPMEDASKRSRNVVDEGGKNTSTEEAGNTDPSGASDGMDSTGGALESDPSGELGVNANDPDDPGLNPSTASGETDSTGLTQNEDPSDQPDENPSGLLRQISGVVQNALHENLSPVSVLLNDGTRIETTTDGRFLFQELEARPYTLQFQADGYRPLTRSAIDPGTTNMKVVLVRDGVLQGEVMDNTNESIAFANVSVRALEGIYLNEIRADAEGRFVIENPPDRAVSLTASQEGFSNEGEGNRIADPPFSEYIVLRLNQPSYSISGMVLNQENGQGVTGFHLIANLDDGSLPEPLQTQSTGSGMYRFDNLKPGTYIVSSDAKQNERLNLVVPIDQDFKTVKVLERDATQVNFPVSAGITVSGIVETEDGRPVGGAEVKVAKIPSAQTLSNFDGHFVLKSVPMLSQSGSSIVGNAEIRLLATHSQYGSGTSEPLPQGSNAPINTVVIQLQGFATLSGFVVDQDELPVFNARLTLIDLITGSRFEQISQPDGSFRFEEVSVAFDAANEFSGTHQINVEHELYSPLQQALTLQSGQNTELHLTLEGGSQISGQVTDTDGNPVAGVTVRTQLPNSGQATTVSEANGSYQFPSLAQGQYDLHFRLNTNPPLTTVLYDVHAGTSGANAVLQALEWRVTGTALNAQTGEPVTNYTINIQGRPVTPGANRFLQTKAVNSPNGTYQQVFHEAGEYFLTFTKPGFENQVTSVRCDPGYREIQYINVQMTPTDQFGGIRGIFNPPANTRLYGINVLGVKNYIAGSNAFEITDLPVGSHNLLFYVVENNGASAPRPVGGLSNFVIEPDNVRNLGTIGADILSPYRNF